MTAAAIAVRRRAIVFSELLAPPFDEGFKNLALAMIREMGRDREVLGLTNFGADVPEYGIRKVTAGKHLFSTDLRSAVRDFAPDDIYYIPTASHTLSSFMRARVLKWYASRARVHLVVLQPRPLNGLARFLIPHLSPDKIWAQSRRSVSLLRTLDQDVGVMPGGVDTERFRPVDAAVKSSLRREFDLAEDAFIVLHVGHIKAKRNVELLCRVQKEIPGVQVVLVGSTSTEQDGELARRITGRGVRIITDYLPHIQQMYQLADCYLFPVLADTGSIEIPLSMLESLACDVPVVTTRYGGMEQQFPDSETLRYADDADGLIRAVAAVREQSPTGMRMQVEPFGWRAVLEKSILADDSCRLRP
jgi:glycosyltransferase involved in cell wall biosynthesis